MKPIDYLNVIESHGYACYLVGGYVRDTLTGISTNDVDIATDALPKEIAQIFDLTTNDHLGCIRLVDSNYTIDITTFRKECSYENRRPKSIEYTHSIDEDLIRRDFTINAICIDKDNHIYDPFGGVEDLKNGIIRVIGDVEKKFTEDPLRMLRALRFSIVYSFQIESSALNFIVEHSSLLTELSFERKKNEIDKILLSENATEGLKRLEKLGILSSLSLKLQNGFHSVKDLIGSWAQIECPKYPFTKLESSRLENIKTIVAQARIDKDSLFSYGIYDNLVAGEILGLDNNYILSIYNDMPIHNEEELEVDGNSIKSILGIKSGPIIKEIKKDLIREVLSGNLPNSDGELSNYIRKKWK